MFILENVSSDSSWRYTFIIMMVVILIGCGIYTYIKAYLNKKKDLEETVTNNPNNEYTKAVLDNEDIILKKKD